MVINDKYPDVSEFQALLLLFCQSYFSLYSKLVLVKFKIEFSLLFPMIQYTRFLQKIKDADLDL